MQTRRSSPSVGLIAGDAAAMAVVTVVGFSTHGELAGAGLRILTTFLPLCIAWGLIAPWLGLYDRSLVCQPRQLWRPILAAVLAAPLAGLLRSLALNSAPILPIFVLVLGATSALAVFLWRILWFLFQNRRRVYG